MQKSLIVSLITIILVLVFALQNPGQAELKFLFWNAQVSLALLALIAMGVGVILGSAFIYPVVKKRNRKIRSLNNFIEEFREKERNKVEKQEQHNMGSNQNHSVE